MALCGDLSWEERGMERIEREWEKEEEEGGWLVGGGGGQDQSDKERGS